MMEGLTPYPSYASALVPWADRLPAHWSARRGKGLFAESKLRVRDDDEIVTCFRDGQVTLRTKRRTSGFMIALKEAGYQGVRRGQLVIHAMDAFAGAVGISDSDGKCTPEYIVCNPRDPATSPGYFARALRLAAHSNFIQVSCPAVRERAPRLRYPNFGDMLLPVPPPDEQAAIVRFLDHADRRIRRYIRAKQKLIKLLEEQQQAIINRAVTRGLDPGVPMKDSGVSWLGCVPAHWKVVALRRYWNVIDCKHVTVPFVEEGIPLASVREAQSFDLRCDSANRTTREWFERLIEGGRRPRFGDLVYCRNVSVGAAAFVGESDDFAMGQDVCLIRSDDQNQRWLNYYLRSPAMAQQLAMILVGSTFNRINVADIKSLIVPVPPRREQDAIASYLDRALASFGAARSTALQEIDLLRELRTRLIADVVTGQLDVRAAAAALPDEPTDDEPVDDIDEIGDEDLDAEADAVPDDDDA